MGVKKISIAEVKKFQKIVHEFYSHNRRSLPWRKASVSPYEILVSEIMLQQTQVDRVIPKYKDFIKKFPNFKKLEKATLADVLRMWQGLGYNRRAKMLHECAKVVTQDYNDKLPRDAKTLQTLPGIGPYTAGAIMTFAYNTPITLIETNIRTVYIYHFFPKRKNVSDTELLPVIEQTLDRKNPREWFSALMDYGTYIKKEHGNKSTQSKHYTKQSAFAGSNRQIRGAILRLLSTHNSLSEPKLYTAIQAPKKKVQPLLRVLEKEGFIVKNKHTYHLA